MRNEEIPFKDSLKTRSVSECQNLFPFIPPIPVPCNHLLQAKSSPSFPYATRPLLCRGEELSQAVSGIPGTASLQEGGEKITALESRVENLLRTGVLAL